MAEPGYDILLIIVGWTLGLLGSPVADAIRNRRAAAALRESLAIELDELQRRLAYDAFIIADHLGAFDHRLVRWLLGAYRDYRGLYADAETVKLLEEFATHTDDQLHRMNASRTHGTGRVLIPKRVLAPVLDSVTPMLPHMERELQQRVLEIRRILIALEEHGEAIREQYRLTFTEDGSRQKDRLTANIGILSRLWLAAARDAADISQSVVIALRRGA
jgi:hypothetical protein